VSKVTVSIINMSKNLDNHSHDNVQILMPLNGVVFLKSEFTEYTIDEKSLAIIPPNVVHYYNGSKDNQVLILDFPKSLLKQDDFHQLKDVRFYFLNESMQLVSSLLQLELEKSTSNFAVDYIFYYLYDLLLSKPHHDSIEYIFKNYDNSISIKELALIEHYSENYYREWFRKKTGFSPSAYIQRLRVEKAKELLITTKYSITEIAYMVGFAHHSSFTRAFTELTGTYPSNYRKNHI